jgi:hypothetical protein
MDFIRGDSFEVVINRSACSQYNNWDGPGDDDDDH